MKQSSDPIEQLLRLAGTSNSVSEDRKRSAFAAAESEWTALVNKRKVRKRATTWLAAAAVVTLTIVGGGFWFGNRAVPGLNSTIAHVEAWSGTVAIGGIFIDDDLTAGRPVAAGTEITTGDGRLALRLASGHTVRLDVESHLVVLSPTRLALERGALYFDSDSDGAASDPVEILTPFGSAYDVGTRYSVRIEPSALRVRVRDGHVRIERPDRTYDAPEGTETTIGAMGEVERSFVSSYGPAWDWTLEIVPGFEIEGKPLRDLLEWSAHEAGWRLAYTDPGVPALAAEIRMSGSIDELTIEEALATVLSASGLDYRIDDGTLIVTDPGGNANR